MKFDININNVLNKKISSCRNFFLYDEKLIEIFDLSLNSIINNLNLFIISKNSYIKNFFQQIENSVFNFRIFNFEFNSNTSYEELYGINNQTNGFFLTSDLALLECNYYISDKTYENLFSLIKSNFREKKKPLIYSFSNMRLIKNNNIWKNSYLKVENNIDFSSIQLFKKVNDKLRINKNDLIFIGKLIDETIKFNDNHNKILFSINDLLIRYNKKIKGNNNKLNLITDENFFLLVKLIKTDAFIKNKDYISEKNFYVIKNFLSDNFMHLNVIDYIISDYFKHNGKQLSNKNIKINIINKFLITRKNIELNFLNFLSEINMYVKQKTHNKFCKKKYFLFNNFYYIFTSKNDIKIYIDSSYFDKIKIKKTKINCYDNSFNKVSLDIIIDENKIIDLCNNVEYFVSCIDNLNNNIFLKNEERNKIIKNSRFIFKKNLDLYEELNKLIEDIMIKEPKDYLKIVYDYDRIKKINSLLINFINFLLKNKVLNTDELLSELKILKEEYAVH